MILNLIDIILLKVKINEEKHFTYNFFIPIHYFAIIFQTVVMIISGYLILQEYDDLIERHIRLRYSVHLKFLKSRNRLWVSLGTLCMITTWILFSQCNHPPFFFICILLICSSLSFLFTYGNRYIILCPLLYTPNRDMLPQDRASIINQSSSSIYPNSFHEHGKLSTELENTINNQEIVANRVSVFDSLERAKINSLLNISPQANFLLKIDPDDISDPPVKLSNITEINSALTTPATSNRNSRDTSNRNSRDDSAPTSKELILTEDRLTLDTVEELR